MRKRFYESIGFIKFKDRFKDREIKIEKQTEKLFIKPIIVSMEGMDRFEEEEMKKIRPVKHTQYD